MRSALAAMLALLLVACGTFSATFVPYAPRAGTIERAKWAVATDLDALAAAGATYVGTLQTRAHRMSADDRRDHVAAEAARCGGTHVMRVDLGLHEQVIATSSFFPGSPSAADTLARAHVGRWTVSTFDLFYVPQDRWPALPEPLRP